MGCTNPSYNVTVVLGEELSSNPPIAHKTLLKPLRIPGEVALETPEHEFTLISSTPEELSSTSIWSRFSNISNQSPTIGAKGKKVLYNIRPSTSMGNEETKHFGKFGSTEISAGSHIRLTRIKSIYSWDDGLNSGNIKSKFARPTQCNRDTANLRVMRY